MFLRVMDLGQTVHRRLWYNEGRDTYQLTCMDLLDLFPCIRAGFNDDRLVMNAIFGVNSVYANSNPSR